MTAQGVEPSYKASWYPFSNYLCLAFVALIAVIMLSRPGLRTSIIAIPSWVLFIWLCFRVRLFSRRCLARLTGESPQYFQAKKTRLREEPGQDH